MEDREPYITGGSVRDKYLTEAMGLCWHVWKLKHGYLEGHECVHCKKYWSVKPTTQIDKTDFSVWIGFGKLWNFSIEQDWWDDFIETTWQELKSGEFQPDWVDNQLGIMPHLISPNKFSDAIYEYLKNKVDKEGTNVL